MKLLIALIAVSSLGGNSLQGPASEAAQDKAPKLAKIKPELKVGELGLPPHKGPRKRVVVNGIEVKVQGVATSAPTPSGATTVVTLDLDQPVEFGTGLTEMLMTALIESGRFVVLERQNLADTAAERQVTGANSPQRLLGGQIVIRGAITELKMRRSGAGVEGAIGENAQFSRTRAEAIVGLDLRVIEVETGRVLDSVRAEGKAVSQRQTLSISADEFKFGTATFDNGPLGGAVRAAIREAVKKICLRAESVAWEGRVALVAEGDKPDVFLNAGADAGLAVGDLLQVRRPGVTITDPVTEAVLGVTQGEVVGILKVKSVQEGFSIAEIVEGAGFARGDIVRFQVR